MPKCNGQLLSKPPCRVALPCTYHDTCRHHLAYLAAPDSLWPAPPRQPASLHHQPLCTTVHQPLRIASRASRPASAVDLVTCREALTRDQPASARRPSLHAAFASPSRYAGLPVSVRRSWLAWRWKVVGKERVEKSGRSTVTTWFGWWEFPGRTMQRWYLKGFAAHSERSRLDKPHC